MSTGSAGSTFASELNRLANGGTYPLLGNYLGIDHAANVWAGTTALSLVAALNARAGTVALELSHVCNVLAGTTALSETDALRSRAS